MNPLERQIQQLKELYASSTAERLGSGATLITVPGVSLPEGWAAESVTVRFIAPIGYPFAAPDCFWTEASLRLKAHQNLPQASNLQQIPEVGASALWFSWHVSAWNPSRDSLITYLYAIKRRFAMPQ